MKKKLSILLILTCFIICFIPINAYPSKSNRQIVKNLVKPLNKPIRFVNYNSKNSDYIISHRKNKNYIVVEKIISISNGRGGGWTCEGGYLAYNKKVAKNKLVTSYIIYSSATNYFDDVLWVVDNKTYR